MLSSILHLPIWQAIRSLGIVSYLMLAAGVCLGIAYGFPGLNPAVKRSLYKLHSFFTVGGTGVGLLHGLLTVIDPYMPFSWTDLLVPFTAKHDPFLNGLGTVAGFGMLVIILTTDLRHKLGKKLWLAIHVMAYPLFLMSFVHGFFLGTDSKLPAIRWMYILSLMAVLGITVLRGSLRGGSQPKTQSLSAR